MKRTTLFTVLFLLVGAQFLTAQVFNPATVTIISAGNTVLQDSLDVKLAKKDSTGNVGATYWTASKAVADTTFKKNQLATKVAKADTTTEAGGSYFTATQAKRDSTNRNVLIGLRVAKVDTTTEAGGSYVTPTQFKADTTYRAAQAALWTSGSGTLTNDSLQVTISGLTASSIITAQYITVAYVKATTEVPLLVRRYTGKFTIYGTTGNGVMYLVKK